MNVKLVLAVVLAALVVLFTAQNYQIVEIRFFFWTLSMSRAVLLFAVLAVGVVLGWLLRSFTARDSG